MGGYLDGPNGVKMRITKQEFPYDIGIFRNIQQGLDSSPLLWLWPFAPTLKNESGLHFETNGFEDPGSCWPPPDPDRLPQQREVSHKSQSFIFDHSTMSTQNYVEAFHKRQAQDLMRFGMRPNAIVRNEPFQRPHTETESSLQTSKERFAPGKHGNEGAEMWRSSEGDSLSDFGVDEGAEFYDEEQLPLAEILRRRRSKARPPDAGNSR
ncbi:MAG: hypothetical protein Q9191_006160 [Dirinaria sp. TL-2023a]